MDQIHKKFTTEQVKFFLDKYLQGLIDRSTIEEILDIKKTRFFNLLKEYKTNKSGFSIDYQRETPKKI